VTWPESSLPLESDGEVPADEFDDESELDESVLDGVVVVVEVDSACAAAAASPAPARLATTSPAVIAVVRRRPLSRSIDRLP
jgi:hypothetical protein